MNIRNLEYSNSVYTSKLMQKVIEMSVTDRFNSLRKRELQSVMGCDAFSQTCYFSSPLSGQAPMLTNS